MGAKSKPAPNYYVYIRSDGYVHMLNASSEDTARTLLKIEPFTYMILECCPSIEAAHERITRERHPNL